MLGADKGLSPLLDGTDLNVGIVRSRFNAGITDELLASALAQLAELGVSEDHIVQIDVPGALEIPVALQALADRDTFDALIALGSVIRGETYHFELVSNESSAGVSRIALDYGLPISNAILTTENEQQAQVRATEKGRDAARVAVEMANLLKNLS